MELLLESTIFSVDSISQAEICKEPHEVLKLKESEK